MSGQFLSLFARDRDGFEVSIPSGRYSTESDIAMWYNGGKWWVPYRASTASSFQKVKRTSVTGGAAALPHRYSYSETGPEVLGEYNSLPQDMGSQMMKANYMNILAAVFLFGCTQSNQGEKKVPLEKVNPSVGLPLVNFDADCETVARPTVGEWMSESDSIFYGTVSSVSILDDIVVQSHGDGERIDVEQCDPSHFIPGLTVVLEDVVTLSGVAVTDTAIIKLGSNMVGSWTPTPQIALDGSLKWSSDAQTIGVGLKLGGRLWQMPDGSGAYFPYTNGLFEVTPQNEVVIQAEPCLEPPSKLVRTDITSFAASLRSAKPSNFGAKTKATIAANPDRTISYLVSTSCLERGHQLFDPAENEDSEKDGDFAPK